MDDIVEQIHKKLKSFSQIIDNLSYANKIKIGDSDDHESILNTIDELIEISSRLGRVFAVYAWVTEGNPGAIITINGIPMHACFLGLAVAIPL